MESDTPLLASVNRTPVPTLWATIVAERLGYPPETALTFGRAVCSGRCLNQGTPPSNHGQSAERGGAASSGGWIEAQGPDDSAPRSRGTRPGCYFFHAGG
jgi:hypothetical protein